ncbi:MAG TPA: CHAD domain-containing protein [Vicinamibacterales bacterium]|nr:CHAD domain-containing protein [Vicinamibacterales bacterium]
MSHSTTRSELLRRRLDQLTRALPGFEQGDVRALHRARVASRRLRELAPVLQLDHAASRKLSRRLRKLTSHLGTVRELDVLMLGIDEMHEARRVQSGALARVGVAVSKERDRARRRMFARAPIQDTWRLTRKLERVGAQLKKIEASESRAATREWKWGVDARLERRAARLVTAVQDAGTVYIPERLHVVRIALKKLRYAFELASDVNAVRADADLRAFKRAQDLLGRMHDLQVLIERVRQVQASLVPPNIAVWRELDALMVSLEDDCRRLHARYMRTREDLAAIAARLADIRVSTSGSAQRTRRAG